MSSITATYLWWSGQLLKFANLISISYLLPWRSLSDCWLHGYNLWVFFEKEVGGIYFSLASRMHHLTYRKCKHHFIIARFHFIDLLSFFEAASTCCCQNRRWKEVVSTFLLPSSYIIFLKSTFIVSSTTTPSCSSIFLKPISLFLNSSELIVQTLHTWLHFLRWQYTHS